MSDSGSKLKAYERVIDYIQGEIFKGTLKRGEKLPPERDLAEQLGVSRNSVREAMRTLSLLGFISSTQGAGNFVSCDLEKNLIESTRMMLMMGEADYCQISELRQGLESQAVLLAAGRITAAQAARLEDIAAQMRACSNQDLARSSALDNELHFVIGEASCNQLILVVLRALSETIRSFIDNMHRRIMSDPELGRRLQATHQGIVQALLSRDGMAAAQMMRDHFQVVDNAILEMEQSKHT